MPCRALDGYRFGSRPDEAGKPRRGALVGFLVLGLLSVATPARVDSDATTPRESRRGALRLQLILGCEVSRPCLHHGPAGLDETGTAVGTLDLAAEAGAEYHEVPPSKPPKLNSAAFKSVPETRELRDQVRAAAAKCGTSVA